MRLRMSIEIQATTERVWDLLASERLLLELGPGLSDIAWQGLPADAGSIVTGVHVGDDGLRTRRTAKCLVSERPHLREVLTTVMVVDRPPGRIAPPHYEIRESHRIEPRGKGCRLDAVMVYRMRGWWRMAAWAFRAQVRDQLRASLTRVKELVEEDPELTTWHSTWHH